MTTPANDFERAAKATASQERALRRHERREKIAARLERLTYSVDEVSVALGRDPATIWRCVKAGTIASVKVAVRGWSPPPNSGGSQDGGRTAERTDEPL